MFKRNYAEWVGQAIRSALYFFLITGSDCNIDAVAAGFWGFEPPGLPVIWQLSFA